MKIRNVFFVILLFQLFSIYAIINIDPAQITATIPIKTQYFYKNQTKESLNEPPIKTAKRVAVVLLDGCQADSFFRDLGSDARNIIEKKGVFGISISRPPTITRPNLVTAISGNYETLFDYVLHYIGSDFKLNTWLHHTKLSLISCQLEDGDLFDEIPNTKRTGYDNEKLTEWEYPKQDIMMMDALIDLIGETSKDAKYSETLQGDKIGIFSLLTSVDWIGHKFRPGSEKYTKGMNRGVGEAMKLENYLKDLFNDEDTAFYIGADHGMSFVGAHGDHEYHQMATPFLMWGPGLNKPELASKDDIDQRSEYYKELFSAGKIDQYKFSKINQKQIAPLLSVLNGVELPTENLGKLDINLLDPNLHFRSASLLANGVQSSRYLLDLKGEHPSWLTRLVLSGKKVNKEDMEQRIADIQDLIRDERYEKAIRETDQFLDESLGLIFKLKKKNANVTKTLILLCYIACGFGWLATFIPNVLNHEKQAIKLKGEGNNLKYEVLFWFTILILVSFFINEFQITRIYVLSLFLIFFLRIIFINHPNIKTVIKSKVFLQKNSKSNIFIFAFLIVDIIISYFSTFWIFIPILWLIFNVIDMLEKKHKIYYLITGIVLCGFPILPRSLSTQVFVLFIGLLFLAGVPIFIMKKILGIQFSEINLKQRLIYGFQIILMVLTIFIIIKAKADTKNAKGSSEPTRYLSLTFLILPFILPFFTDSDYRLKIISYFYATCCPILLFSNNSEPIFISLYFALLMIILSLIDKIVKRHPQIISLIPPLTVILCHFSMYGQGFSPSFSSLSLEFCFRFVGGIKEEIMIPIVFTKLIVPHFFTVLIIYVIYKKLDYPQPKSLWLLYFFANLLTGFFIITTDVSPDGNRQTHYFTKALISAMIITFIILISFIPKFLLINCQIDKITLQKSKKSGIEDFDDINIDEINIDIEMKKEKVNQNDNENSNDNELPLKEISNI
ncbi:phosphatidylinositol glycan class n [Anaeramoeba flamelloides]|uniref:GPI ethanolamine phosphate transferase 1 n=1 Tax=Anaeramoeba flamelloides TaxID=1746091 RepID=A0AAV8AFT4_9EUKA|nr:phosphatidylinositol glycan class n [Anaeramoeba flamelloides]